MPDQSFQMSLAGVVGLSKTFELGDGLREVLQAASQSIRTDVEIGFFIQWATFEVQHYDCALGFSKLKELVEGGLAADGAPSRGKVTAEPDSSSPTHIKLSLLDHPIVSHFLIVWGSDGKTTLEVDFQAGDKRRIAGFIRRFASRVMDKVTIRYGGTESVPAQSLADLALPPVG